MTILYFGLLSSKTCRFIISATHAIISGEQSSPPDFRQLETIGRDDLLLSTDQSMALLNSNAPLGFPPYLQSYFELKKTTVEQCNGLIGASCKSVSFYGDQIRHHVPTQIDCLRLYYSKKFLDHLDRCFGIVDNSRLYPKANNVLLKCVLGEDINSNTNVRLLDILMSFAKAGILLFDGNNFMFSSLLAKRYFTNRYFPIRASSDPPNLRKLVMKAIGRPSNHLRQVQLISRKKPRSSICLCLDSCVIRSRRQQFAQNCQDLFKLELK